MSPIERTKKCSDDIIALLATQEEGVPADVAVMGCLDAATRIVKKAKVIGNVEAIDVLINTLEAIQVAEGG